MSLVLNQHDIQRVEWVRRFKIRIAQQLDMAAGDENLSAWTE